MVIFSLPTQLEKQYFRYLFLHLLFAFLLPRSLEIISREVRVGFVVDVMTLGQTFLSTLPSCLISVPCSYIVTAWYHTPIWARISRESVYSFIHSLFNYVMGSSHIAVTSGMVINKWEQMPWPTSRYFPGICLDGLRNTTRLLSEYIRCPGQDSNRTPLEYKSDTLPRDPVCSETHSHTKWQR
jgi:hypothetical protein